MKGRLRRLGIWLMPGLALALPWTAVLGWEQFNRYRSARAEVSTGVYLGMIDALGREPKLAASMRAALADGKIENRELLPIMDQASEFMIPNADHWNPVAQTAARRRLEATLSQPHERRLQRG